MTASALMHALASDAQCEAHQIVCDLNTGGANRTTDEVTDYIHCRPCWLKCMGITTRPGDTVEVTNVVVLKDHLRSFFERSTCRRL